MSLILPSQTQEPPKIYFSNKAAVVSELEKKQISSVKRLLLFSAVWIKAINSFVQYFRCY